jgi:hypothetical protein
MLHRLTLPDEVATTEKEIQEIRGSSNGFRMRFCGDGLARSGLDVVGIGHDIVMGS